jgi:glycosyl transferase family 5 (putative starch synthase catalytic subunit)
MYVMVASECAPTAKAGGLGDVVSGLSRELELRGNAVEIILPKYASMQYSDIWDLRPRLPRLRGDCDTQPGALYEAVLSVDFQAERISLRAFTQAWVMPLRAGAW